MVGMVQWKSVKKMEMIEELMMIQKLDGKVGSWGCAALGVDVMDGWVVKQLQHNPQGVSVEAPKAL